MNPKDMCGDPSALGGSCRGGHMGYGLNSEYLV